MVSDLVFQWQNLAYEYAKRGAQLALVARRESSLEEAAEAARYYGSPEVITIAGDVSELSDCRRIIDDTMNHFGRCKFESEEEIQMGWIGLDCL